MSRKNKITRIMAALTSLRYGAPSLNFQPKRQYPPSKLCHCMINNHSGLIAKKRAMRIIKCSSNKGGIGITDFIGGDLLRLHLGQWLSDVEEHKPLAIYTPHEGGYKGRYLTRLRYQGYYFLDITARGLGAPETTLTKVHPVCPVSVKIPDSHFLLIPPEVDYRLEVLPPDAILLWYGFVPVLSKSELQFLALLPSLRPKVRVIAECGNGRKFMWKPLKEIAGLAPLKDA